MFSKILQETLKRKGISQSYVARRLGVSNARVSNYCLRRSLPDISTLVEIADILDVSLDCLLGLKDIDSETFIPLTINDGRLKIITDLISVQSGNFLNIYDADTSNIVAYLQIDDSVLFSSDNYFGLRINRSDDNLYVKDGDIVFIKKIDSRYFDVEEGKDFLCTIKHDDDDATGTMLRRCIVDKESLLIFATNTHKIVKKENCEVIKGTAVGLWRNYKR